MTEKTPKRYTYDIEKIFTSWYRSLCFFAFRFIQEEEAAKDIVQDTFARMVEKKTVFESELHLKNFLYMSIKNDCLNYLRRKSSEKNYLENLPKDAFVEDTECRMVETELFEMLQKALDRLPRECRKVFELCYFQEMDNETAARTLGISIETVKAQKRRGKQILREKLKDFYPLIALFFGLC